MPSLSRFFRRFRSELEHATSRAPAATTPAARAPDSLPWFPWEDLERATNNFDEQGGLPHEASVWGSSVFLCTMAVDGVSQRVAVQVFWTDYEDLEWRRDDRFDWAKRDLSRPEFVHPSLFRPIGYSCHQAGGVPCSAENPRRGRGCGARSRFEQPPPQEKRALVFSVPGGPTLLSLLGRDSVQADGGGQGSRHVDTRSRCSSPRRASLEVGVEAEVHEPLGHAAAGEGQPLSWAQRLRIAEGVAQGLAHLHRQCIVHLSVSADNIIVDGHMEAHVATTAVQWCWWDDEQSCNYPAGITLCWGSRIPDGLYGEKRARDVYDLGELLLLLATGRAALPTPDLSEARDGEEPESLLSPAGGEEGVTDSTLLSRTQPLLQFQRFLALARQCCGQGRGSGPTMERVAEILGEIRQGVAASAADQWIQEQAEAVRSRSGTDVRPSNGFDGEADTSSLFSGEGVLDLDGEEEGAREETSVRAEGALPPLPLSPGCSDCPASEGSARLAAGEEEQEDVQRNAGKCCICFEEQADVACIPCGHMCGCSGCMRKVHVSKGSCSVCKADLGGLLKVYLAGH